MPNSDTDSLLGNKPIYEDDLDDVPTASSLYETVEGEFSNLEQEGNPFFSSVAANIVAKFNKAKQDREIHEARWLNAFQNYRGDRKAHV